MEQACPFRSAGTADFAERMNAFPTHASDKLPATSLKDGACPDGKAPPSRGKASCIDLRPGMMVVHNAAVWLLAAGHDAAEGLAHRTEPALHDLRMQVVQ